MTGEPTHISVTIAGRSYRMACDEGQEEHLLSLGRLMDARIDSLRGSFGEIGDMRLSVMAGIMFADELSEAQARIAALEADVARMKAQKTATENTMGAALSDAASRIERLAKALNEGAGRRGT